MSENCNRMYMYLSEEDIKEFDDNRNSLGYTRREYLKHLMQVEKNKEPVCMKYKDIVEQMAELTTISKALILTDKGITDMDRQTLNLKMEQLNSNVRELLK